MKKPVWILRILPKGRMIEEIDQDENVNLVKRSKQGEAHETVEHGMESDVDFSTASPQNDDDEITLAKTLVNIKRSAVKDKGKAIMQETEPPKKIKKREMIQIGHNEDLAQKLHAEELAKKEVASKSSQAHDIDWSDPTVIRYHTLQNRSFSVLEVRKNMCMYLKNQGGYKMSHFKGMKYEEIRPIFERIWDQNQAFIPKDSEIEKEVMKRSGFIQKQSTKEEKEKKKDEESSKQVEEETFQKEDVIPEQVVKESSRKAEGRLKRKASKPREDKEKRQKKQDDPEKLMEYVEVISDSEEVISVTPLAVKSPVIGWKSYCKEDVGYYKIHRADGSYKTYIFFSQMLNDFDREDLIMLYRLFNEKYASTRLESLGIELYDSCGVHSLMLGEDCLGEDASKQGRIDAIDADEEITLVSVHDVNVSAGEEVFVAEQDVVEEVVEVINTAKLIISAATTVSAATTTTATIKTVDDITLAQALDEMKSIKPKKKRVVIQELSESTTTISSQLSSQQSQEKKAKIDDDHQLAERMQAQEQD
ncbi:hypothetical protein Tco_0991751 [Tanacetum coccineum]|uniref:Uncharacterized protein n=1 Tax=Tanacetum coccineum TaxID=301880 RepID=A0ABQ5F1U9_9ASTR